MMNAPLLSPRLLQSFVYLSTTAAALIIGAGWGSTGTRSVSQGLTHLGVTTGHCSHYVNTSLKEPKWCPLDLCQGYRVELERALCEHRNGAPISVFRIFDNLEAVFDSPIPLFFPYIFKAYPDAKVILTSRNGENWYGSRMKHMGGRTDAFPMNTLPVYTLLRGAFCRSEMPSEKGILATKETVLLAYRAHLALVRDIVPPSQLLDIDVTTAPANVTWRRLAEFVGKELPPRLCLEEGCRFPNMSNGKTKGYSVRGNLTECSACARRPSCVTKFSNVFENSTALFAVDDDTA